MTGLIYSYYECIFQWKMYPCNKPFYKCWLSDLVFEWQRGCSGPCFETDLTTFIVQIKLFLC